MNDKASQMQVPRRISMGCYEKALEAGHADYRKSNETSCDMAVDVSPKECNHHVVARPAGSRWIVVRR